MNLKEKIKKGISVYGTWCIIPSPEVINVIATAGLDFVIIDMEHGPTDFITAQRMVIAAEAAGSNAIIRVSNNDETNILKALDVGPSGLIVPHIENVEDCRRSMAYQKFPPVGIRGFSPYTKAGRYSSIENYTTKANSDLLSGIIVEGKEGIKNLPEILKNSEVDIVYIGTYDISASLGIAGDVTNHKVINILEDCVKKIRDSGKAAGCLFHNESELGYFKTLGINFLVYSVDTKILLDGYSKLTK